MRHLTTDSSPQLTALLAEIARCEQHRQLLDELSGSEPQARQALDRRRQEYAQCEAFLRAQSEEYAQREAEVTRLDPQSFEAQAHLALRTSLGHQRRSLANRKAVLDEQAARLVPLSLSAEAVQRLYEHLDRWQSTLQQQLRQFDDRSGAIAAQSVRLATPQQV
ncbi:hypothetical protein [Gloeobacter kilaueensis]|uniref:Uncharacterized protein n=1 Tax=Gloeobacter kilaueensis (strain ATCC BAA-2537 / CCAP 1431/1 / ULC 316 / JS1) TaxID=1183438 RepID=U5QN04_GLOK1|nr:hypothetical protein [Gloeobacter kilaueensis]AGY58979.1 hypothetical protein GKIL_2733 [Gloeobacter kilaueensis JS1]